MMDNQPRARSHLSIKSRHKNGIGRSDGASVTLNVHPALAANPTGILKTPIRLFLISGIILEFHIYKTPYGVAGSSLTGSIPCRKVAASAAMPEFPAHQKPKHNPFNGLAIDARARADLKNPPTATQGGFVLIFKDSSGRLLRLRLSWF